MSQFNQPKPDSESLGYKPTEYDNLSDAELDKLLHQCGIKVNPARQPQQKRFVDLDKLVGQ